MQTTLHVDLRKGKVYRVPCDSVRQARVIAKSPYYRPSRAVLVNTRVIECYENGALVATERR